MSESDYPTIVVAAYNRDLSLQRLLHSLEKAIYPGKVDLIISIDASDNKKVNIIANEFNWKYGSKEIIVHPQHLGLKNHILFCGNLTTKLNNIILLEDDTFVSPSFYLYAFQALDFYYYDQNICGISLYTQDFSEYYGLNFYPIIDKSDVYFSKIPASYGQIWTKNQWEGFYNKIFNLPEVVLPENVKIWPDNSSWKKLSYKYMVAFDKYYVYPKSSFLMNWGDKGQHYDTKTNYFRNTLSLKNDSFFFNSFTDAFVYDEFNELSEKNIKRFNSLLNNYSFTCDFYGSKKITNIKEKHLLSIKNCRNPIISFDNSLLPIELNVLLNIPGTFIHFGNTCEFEDEVPWQKKEQLLEIQTKVNISGLRENMKNKYLNTLDYRLGNTLLSPIRKMKKWLLPH